MRRARRSAKARSGGARVAGGRGGCRSLVLALLPIALLLGACVKPKQYGGMMQIDQAGVAHRLQVLCLLGVGPSVADESCGPAAKEETAARAAQSAAAGAPGVMAASSATAGPAPPPAPEPVEAEPAPARGTAAVRRRD